MTDRRFQAINARVAHSALAATASDRKVTDGVARSVTAPLTDLCAEPEGARDKELLFGQAFQCLDVHRGWAFGFDPADGYVGYMKAEQLGDPVDPTHRVTTRSTHVYAAADMKSRDLARLSAGSLLSVDVEDAGFLRLTTGGWVPSGHVGPLAQPVSDAASVAEMFLGTPYLWGGNSGFGIDCSGLVLQAMWATGRSAPRDSDLQASQWPPVAQRQDLVRGDLVFWKGHVGMMLDGTRLIHANAHHMMVSIEPLDQAIERIGQKELGQVTGFSRP